MATQGIILKKEDPPAERRLQWAEQMNEGIAYIHTKGVRCSDLRLEYRLLDDILHARLSDFNVSEHDTNETSPLPGCRAIGA